MSLQATLASARLHLHVDVSVGDPIIPKPEDVSIPLLLGGSMIVRGYPLVMVLAEKIVTAIARATVNTRWRDFGDVYLLSRRHPVDGEALGQSIEQVATHRDVDRLPLATVLDGYGAIGQTRWTAWRRRQQLEDRLPEQFDDLVTAVVAFADPAILGTTLGQTWEPGSGIWR